MDNKKEAKYYLILIKHNRDPVIRAHLLKKLYDVFIGVDMPSDIKEFIKNETLRIKNVLKPMYYKKKEEYDKLVKEKNYDLKHDKFGFEK